MNTTSLQPLTEAGRSFARIAEEHADAFRARSQQHDLAGSFPSIEEFAEGQVITREHLRWFHSNYVPNPDEMRHPYASPLFAEDHSGLPPAVIITAGFDPLRDEAQALAKALDEAGVHTQHREYASLGHGFIVADATKVVRDANREICEMLRAVL